MAGNWANAYEQLVEESRRQVEATRAAWQKVARPWAGPDDVSTRYLKVAVRAIMRYSRRLEALRSCRVYDASQDLFRV